MSGVLKKLGAAKGSVFEEAEGGIIEEMPNAIKEFIPNISENTDEIRKAVEYVLGMIKGELGDDENIGIIRNIDGELIISLLIAKETDIDIKSEKTIKSSFNVSELTDFLKTMDVSDNGEGEQ